MRNNDNITVVRSIKQIGHNNLVVIIQRVVHGSAVNLDQSEYKGQAENYNGDRKNDTADPVKYSCGQSLFLSRLKFYRVGIL